MSNKMIFKTNELQRGINIVSKAAPQKTTMEVLMNVLIVAKDGVATLTCSDQEKEISTPVSELGNADVMVAIPVRDFAAILAKLPGEEVSIEVTKESIVIRSGKTRFALGNKNNANTFPIRDKVKGSVFTINGKELADKLKRTMYAAGDAESGNRMMGGIHFLIKSGKGKMTCLDGHRIAVNEFDAPGVKEVDIILPATTGKILLSILKDEDVNIVIQDNNISFGIAGTNISTRLVEGTYFKVESMIAATGTIVATMKRDEINDAISRAKLITDIQGDRKPVIFTLNGDSMNVAVNSSISSMEENVSATIKKGDWDKIAFNPKFIEDALNVVEEEEITMEFTTPKAPMVMRGNSYTHLVLPVNFR